MCACYLCAGHYYTFIGVVNFHILETEKTRECCACRVISSVARNNWNYFRESVRFSVDWLRWVFSPQCWSVGKLFMFLLRISGSGRGILETIVYRIPWELLKIPSMSEKVWKTLFTVKDLLSRKETAFWTEYKRVGMMLMLLVLSEAASFAPPTSLIRSESCLQQQSLSANQKTDSAHFDQWESQDIKHNGQAQQQWIHICLCWDCLVSRNEWFTQHYCVEVSLSRNLRARKYSSGAKHKRYLSRYLWRTCSQ